MFSIAVSPPDRKFKGAAAQPLFVSRGSVRLTPTPKVLNKEKTLFDLVNHVITHRTICCKSKRTNYLTSFYAVTLTSCETCILLQALRLSNTMANISGQQRLGAARACEECRRKKMRCDKKQPQCSLCTRIKTTCSYPTSRKQWTKQKHREGQNNRGGTVKFHNSPHLNSISFMQDLSSVAPNSSLLAVSMSDNIGTDPLELDTLASLQPQTEYFSWFDTSMIGWPDNTFAPLQVPASASTYDQARSSAHGFEAQLDTIWKTSPFRKIQLDECLHFESPSPEERFLGTPAHLAPEVLDTSSEALRPITFSLNIPDGLADRLVDVYFQQAQCFLPLLHQPTFAKQYQNGSQTGQKYTGLSIESALLLNAMFGLSARFCDDGDFMNITPCDRGTSFVKQALELHSEIQKHIEEDNPSLLYIQALIILTYTLLATHPSAKSWNLCGICCHLAYDLDLHEIDADLVHQGSDQSLLSTDEWIIREEQRRAWWMCFEMDTFISAMSRRPFMIDRWRMQVLLPVSDELWFNGIITESVFISAPHVQPWKSLRGSPNQNERAWFLVVNFLLRTACETLSSHKVSSEEAHVREAALTYLSLSLPESFNMNSGRILFSKTTFSTNNWIICTLITIQW
jgi:Fungal specific transcription factor domain/Fungal Zn(2)-Cys(6) binuclear cluster domain